MNTHKRKRLNYLPVTSEEYSCKLQFLAAKHTFPEAVQPGPGDPGKLIEDADAIIPRMHQAVIMEARQPAKIWGKQSNV